MKRRLFLASATAATLGQAAPAWRLGCQTRAFGSPLPQREKLLAALDDIAAAGFSGFETNFASLQHSFDNPGPMRDEIRRRNLELIGLHGSPKLSDPANAAAELEKGTRIAKAIHDLGGSLFVMSGAGIPPAAYETHCRNLDRFGAICRDHGVTLCVHNHARELQNEASEIRAVAAGTDPKNVSFVLDVSFFLDVGLKPERWLPQFAPRMKGVHIRDHKDSKEVLLGEGALDLAAVARSLRQANWSGWVILELNKRTDRTSRQLIEDAKAHMKRTMQL